MALIKRLRLLICLLLAGCLPAVSVGGELTFTSVEQKNDAAYIGQQQYYALDPGLLVILDEEALAASGDLFSESARQQMARMSLETHFLVAVFQGWQASGGYGVTIEAIRIEGDVVRVAAVFQTPEGEGQPGVTSPYHFVAVRRPFNGLAAKTFELISGEQVLAVFPSPVSP